MNSRSSNLLFTRNSRSNCIDESTAIVKIGRKRKSTSPNFVDYFRNNENDLNDL